MDEIIYSYSIQWAAANEAAPVSKVNDSNSLDLRSFLITYNIANLVLIRFGLARQSAFMQCSEQWREKDACMNQNIARHGTRSFASNQATNQPVNSTLNANLVSVIVLMEIFSSFFAFYFFNFHIFQQWQRNWLAFCNHTPDKKSHFFMIL